MPWYSLENISWTGKQTHCMHTRMNTSRTRLDLRFLTLRQSWGNAFPLWSRLVTLSLTVPGNTCLTLSRWDDSSNIVPWPCLDQIEWSNRSTDDIGKSVEYNLSLPRLADFSWKMRSHWKAIWKSSWTRLLRERSLSPLDPRSSLTRCRRRRSKCSSTPSNSWEWRWRFIPLFLIFCDCRWSGNGTKRCPVSLITSCWGLDKGNFDLKNIILPSQLLASPARPSGSPQPQGKHIEEETLLRFSKVFVTHGGLGSLVEAIYHKAVIVGIPLRFHLYL